MGRSGGTPAKLKRLDRIDDADAYHVRVVRRVRLEGELLRVGQTLTTPALSLALRLVGAGFARPADAHTALDVALGLELRRAIPRA
jgi:hypothetical protein